MKKLSPFYPHGGIPVPFSESVTAMCVEAVWQGLKVFENCGIDTELFKNGQTSVALCRIKKIHFDTAFADKYFDLFRL